MTINKFAFSRYKIIDRELRKRDIRTAELKSIIENELSIRVSTRQLQKDMEAMRIDYLLGYNAPIVYNKRKKAYGYIDRKFTIRALSLTEDEINALKFYTSSIIHYKEHSLFTHFSNALRKIAEASGIQINIETFDATASIQTERSPNKGMDFISSIVHCIEQGIIIELDYRSYDEKIATKLKVKPILIKEWKNRWYLLGLPVKKTGKNIIPYALDQIGTITVTQKRFKKDITFNLAQYFKHSFGVSWIGGKVERIEMRIHPALSYQLEMHPLHATQKIIERNTRHITISIDIIPSPEFFDYILGYGEFCTIISPTNIARVVKSRLKKSLRNYQ